ncbi:MAG: hypothetical protein M3512_17845 [Bacteroidota bacterium]|nr:hypothetical protein [Bacteroidota bacterium]
MDTKYLRILIFSIGIIVISCDKEVISQESISPIIKTDLPESGEVGQEIVITVSHAVYNGCGYYSSQKTIQTRNTFFVSFYANYGEGICTMNIPILKTSYKFTPKNTGTYTFKFNSGENDYLTQTIIIK